jgi:hypothetical protein
VPVGPPLALKSHPNISCSACGASPITGTRYKCWVCFDYDLCENCKSQGRTSKFHVPQHSLEAIAPGCGPTKSTPRPLEMIIGKLRHVLASSLELTDATNRQEGAPREGLEVGRPGRQRRGDFVEEQSRRLGYCCLGCRRQA